jgi:hypothetical protein
VEVQIHDDHGTEAEIPEKVNGIPVQTKHRLPYQDGGCNHSDTCYESDYDPISGGVRIGSDYTWGSACCRVEKDGSEYLMGARHVFIDDSNTQDSCSSNSADGESAYQNGDYYGFVSEEFPKYDAVLTKLDSAYGNRDSIGGYIVDQQGSVEGHVTKDGVDAMIADDNSESVEKRGVTHCANTGQVESRETNYCSNINKKGLIRSTNDFGDGDSGGPVYDVNTVNLDKHLYIVNIATQYPSSDCNNGYGSAAYAMNNEYGVTFG